MIGGPWGVLVLILLWGGSLAGTAKWFYAAGQDHANAETATRDQLVQDVSRAAQQSAAEQIAKIEVQHVQITQPLEREIREHVVYRDCVHSPDGLRLVNQALTGRPADAPGGGELPGADAPD